MPSSRPALEAERSRLERELGRLTDPAHRRVLAIERRRIVIRQDTIA